MARGVNKVILVGYLGKDPEVRYTPDQNAVANVSLATTESWKDKTSGEMQERTEWHRVVLFGRLGEIARESLKTGSQVSVEGRLQTRKWQDKDGAERYTAEIVATDMQMLGSRGTGGSAVKPAQSKPSNRAPAAKAVGQDFKPGSDFDDDIPF